MAGYGPEDDHFVVELTYNYGIKEYKLGNDFQVDTTHALQRILKKKRSLDYLIHINFH